MSLRVVNLNDMSKLLSKGMRPVVRSIPHRPRWRRVDRDIKYAVFDYDRKKHDIKWKARPKRKYHARTCPRHGVKRKEDHPLSSPVQPPRKTTAKKLTSMDKRGMNLTMEYTFEAEGECAYFAFCLPFSYSELQHNLRKLDSAMGFQCEAHHMRCIHEDSQEEGFYPDSPFGMPELRNAFQAPVPAKPREQARMTARTTCGNDCKTTPSALKVAPCPWRPYYHRQLLALTNEGRRIDLLTISSRSGITQTRSRTPNVLKLQLQSCWCCGGLPLQKKSVQDSPPSEVTGGASPSESRTSRLPVAKMHEDLGIINTGTAPMSFGEKPIIFVSSRVHPGETPASHMLSGLLQLLLNPANATGQTLLNNFVFKIVPMLNPDGVAHGHYRVDTFGKDLNRVYSKSTQFSNPAIVAVESLIEMLAACSTFSQPRPTALYVSGLGKMSPPRESVDDSSPEKACPDTERGVGSDLNISGSVKGGSAQTSEKPASGQRGRQLHQPDTSVTKNKCSSPRKAQWDAYRSCCHDSRRASRPSRLWAYLDLHAHPSKLGCFIYGNNYKTQTSRQAKVNLFARLMEINCRHFNFDNCSFKLADMSKVDNTGQPIVGSGRVSIQQRVPSLTHCYTVECSYHTNPKLGVKSDKVTSDEKCSGTAQSPLSKDSTSFTQYTKKDFEHMGEAIGRTIADVSGISGVDLTSRLPKKFCKLLSNFRGQLNFEMPSEKEQKLSTT